MRVFPRVRLNVWVLVDSWTKYLPSAVGRSPQAGEQRRQIGTRNRLVDIGCGSRREAGLTGPCDVAARHHDNPELRRAME